jgi:hypothetical protein
MCGVPRRGAARGLNGCDWKAVNSRYAIGVVPRESAIEWSQDEPAFLPHKLLMLQPGRNAHSLP